MCLFDIQINISGFMTDLINPKVVQELDDTAEIVAFKQEKPLRQIRT